MNACHRLTSALLATGACLPVMLKAQSSLRGLTFVATVTASDLAAFGPELAEGNAGTWTMEFSSDSTWARLNGHLIGKQKYSISGDTLRFLAEPTAAYRWALQRDTLRLAAISDGFMPRFSVLSSAVFTVQRKPK